MPRFVAPILDTLVLFGMPFSRVRTYVEEEPLQLRCRRVLRWAVHPRLGAAALFAPGVVGGRVVVGGVSLSVLFKVFGLPFLALCMSGAVLVGRFASHVALCFV